MYFHTMFFLERDKISINKTIQSFEEPKILAPQPNWYNCAPKVQVPYVLCVLFSAAKFGSFCNACLIFLPTLSKAKVKCTEKWVFLEVIRNEKNIYFYSSYIWSSFKYSWDFKLTHYLSALDFWHSLIWNIKFDELDF